MLDDGPGTTEGMPGVETADHERTGVLVLRVWVEAGVRHGLRARITRTVPGGSTESITSAAATVDGVCTVVRRWLEELLPGRERPDR